MEAFLVRFLRHTVIHVGPLVVLAFRAGKQILVRVTEHPQFLEPELRVLFLVVRCLLEKSSDLLVSLLLRYRRKISIFVAGLGLAGKCFKKVLLRFGAGIRVHRFTSMYNFCS